MTGNREMARNTRRFPTFRLQKTGLFHCFRAIIEEGVKTRGQEVVMNS
jgi:hypothetical protein